MNQGGLLGVAARPDVAVREFGGVSRHRPRPRCEPRSVTLAELMARIGHSSPRAALRYQHATARRDRAIASSLDAEIAAVATPVTR